MLDWTDLKRIGQDVEWYLIKGSDGGDHTRDENKQDHSEHKSHMATEKSPWKCFLFYFVLLIMKDLLPRGPQSMPPIAYPRDPPSPAIIVNVASPMAWSSE